MCRKLPGPRCSPDASKRVATAAANLNRIKAKERKLQAAQRAGGESGKAAGAVLRSKRHTTQKNNALERSNYANRVYAQTPEGVRSLRRKGQEAAAGGKPALAGRYADLAQQGVAQRANSYKDLRLVGREEGFLDSERSRVRAVVAQDAAQGKEPVKLNQNARPGEYNANRMKQVVSRMGDDSKKEFVEKRMGAWTDNDYARAPGWVEEGSRKSWAPNPNTRVPKEAGKRISGESRTLRMNMPDGQVAESRQDIQLSQTDKGYAVTERHVVASSYEDISPVQRTQVPLGAHLASDVGQAKSGKPTVTHFGSRDEAEAHIKKVKKTSTGAKQAVSAAKIARDGHVARIAKETGYTSKNAALSRFGIGRRPTYEATSGSQGKQKKAA